MAFLAGWTYRKAKTITGTTAGAQTNYQMQLTVYAGIGADTNTTIYLNNNGSFNDFRDLRFTKADGTTLLDYWIESSVAGVSAVIWIEIDTIPASPLTISIYCYYNNSSAVAVSNGANTCIFFDDFSDGTFNKWNIVEGVPTIAGGIASVTTVSSIQSKTLLGINTQARIRCSVANNTSFATWGFTDQNSADAGANNGVCFYPKYVPNFMTIMNRKTSFATETDVSLGATFVGYHIYHNIRNGVTNTQHLIDNVSKGTIATNVPIVNIPIGFWSQAQTILVDWAIGLNYSSPEPTFSSTGSQGTNSILLLGDLYQSNQRGISMGSGAGAICGKSRKKLHR